jgi:hypothetical protein
MKNRNAEHIHIQNDMILTLILLAMLLVLSSCEDDSYTIEYQDGYPNELAGNWRAIEFQNATVVNDLITDADNISDYFDLVTALDPNSQDSLVIDNIYDSNIRVKVYYHDNTFGITKGRQLEVINHGQYDIYYISVNGKYIIDEEYGDYMAMHIGLYDKYSALFDTMYVVAFRKTGFEDVDYESLLAY